MLKLLGNLALTNLKKNRNLYFPYALTVITMVVITYILRALSKNPTLGDSYGGDGYGLTLSLGVFVMQIVSLLTILYANSFVMKNRSKELGLYSILGLDRAQIQILSLLETVLFAVASVLIGIVLGILFNRLAFALLLKAMRYPITLAYSFEWGSALWIVIFFTVIFGIVMMVNAIRVQSSRPLELLKAKKQGEIKGKFLLARTLFGGVLLVIAYSIAQTVVSPIKSIYMFFVAVILVVIATYILFDAGSIMLLNFLKNRKSFYYQPTNFISVSNLIFRMRKNAAGLASICILSTMVLVTVATTASLQVGADHLINQQFPQEYELQINVTASDSVAQVREEIPQLLASSSYKTKDFYDYSQFLTAGVIKNGVLDTSRSALTVVPEAVLQILPNSDYNRLTNQSLSVSKGHVVVADNSKVSLKRNFDTIQLGKETFEVAGEFAVDTIASKIPTSPLVTDRNYFIVMNDDDMDTLTQTSQTDEQTTLLRTYMALWSSSAVTSSEKEQETAAYNAFLTSNQVLAGVLSTKEDSAQTLFLFYGSLLFLGILLSIAFLVGAILVIYYKQVSEGYEDRDRYSLLRKIGIDKQTIHQSINRQVLIVFFLPLLTAFLHTALAYKMITKILLLFGISGPIVLYTMLLVGMIFMVTYLIVYRMTSRSYYRIVSLSTVQ